MLLEEAGIISVGVKSSFNDSTKSFLSVVVEKFRIVYGEVWLIIIRFRTIEGIYRYFKLL